MAADVAAPPLPLKLALPVPAIVDIIPVDIVTLRTRLLPQSATYTLPEESRATPSGRYRVLDVAGRLSPLKVTDPVPAMVTTVNTSDDVGVLVVGVAVVGVLVVGALVVGVLVVGKAVVGVLVVGVAVVGVLVVGVLVVGDLDGDVVGVFDTVTLRTRLLK